MLRAYSDPLYTLGLRPANPYTNTPKLNRTSPLEPLLLMSDGVTGFPREQHKQPYRQALQSDAHTPPRWFANNTNPHTKYKYKPYNPSTPAASPCHPQNLSPKSLKQLVPDHGPLPGIPPHLVLNCDGLHLKRSAADKGGWQSLELNSGFKHGKP